MASRRAKDQVSDRAQRERPTPRPPVRPPWLLLLLAVVAIVAAVLVLMKSPEEPRPQASPVAEGPPRSPATSTTATAPADVSTPAPQALLGRWQRTDGDYALEIRRVHADGRAEAAYSNPGPINVSRAEVRRSGNGLTLLVELRDVNYPGATYRLEYQPGSQEVLVGSYHQPALGQTYGVGFLRAR